MTISTQSAERSEQALARIALYDFWSTFFLGAFDHPLWRERAAQMPELLSACFPAASAENTALHLPENEALERDFAKRFYGVGDETFALTQSAWTENPLLLTGRATTEVLAIYRRHNLLPQNDSTSLPSDHLGLMLGFLAALAQSERPEDRAAEASFFLEHIACWWPEAQARIAAADGAAAPLLKAFGTFVRRLAADFSR